MQQVPVTSLYAAVLSLLFIALSIRVIAARRAARVAIGVGGQKDLERRARVHANFAEYVPLALVLLLFLETANHSVVLSHTLGAALVGGRLLHAFGVSQRKEDYRFRVAGMTITFAVIASTSALLVVDYARAIRAG